MILTTNTEGEPGTQDKSTQHEYLDTSRMLDEQDPDYAEFMVDRKNTSGMKYFSILYDNISEMSVAKNQEDPGPSTGHCGTYLSPYTFVQLYCGIYNHYSTKPDPFSSFLSLEEAPPSTQGELPLAASETVPGSFPKPAPSTLALFPEFMTFDLHTAITRVAKLKRENAQLKVDLPTANAEISTLKDRMLSEQSVHNNRIDKLFSLIEKTTHSSS
ncbi:hypothetical protein HAX54_006453 [Datura stramonium]|uniref:Uncharacterized protein n=1 Tax=Datura stramonium TaxID=4076 RepID=A0ABS8TAC5_DATST|nr:hypothetical protein [Datura stramonium]